MVTVGLGKEPREMGEMEGNSLKCKKRTAQGHSAQSDKEIKIRVRDVEGRDRMEPCITVGIQYTEERMCERFSKPKKTPKIFSYKIHKNHTES